MNTFIIASVISLIFFILKFIEMKMFEKELKPLKYLVRDALLVYFSVLFGNLIISQITPISEPGTAVFTDNPTF
jgi:hypothetical protein